MAITDHVPISQTGQEEHTAVNIPLEVNYHGVKLYNFRYRKNFYAKDIKVFVNREGVAKIVAYEVPEEALSKGWQLYKKGTKEEHKDNQDFQIKLKPLLPRYCQGVGHERSYGNCLFAIINDEYNNAHLRVFEPEDYKIKQDDYGNITYAEASETVLGNSTEIKYVWREPEELKNIYHLVLRPSKNIGQGKSYIEPIMDDIVGLNLVKEHTTIFVIRNGAGRLILYVSDALYKDDSFMSSMEDSLAKQNSANSVLIVPMGPDEGFKPEMDLAISNQPYSVLEYRDIFLRSISAYSGLPASRLEGEDQNYASADKNELAYFDVLQKIQEDTNDLAKWLTDRLGEAYFKGLGEYDIAYNVRQELTEEGRIQELMSKFNLLIRIMQAKDDLQIDLEAAKEMVEIEYKTTKIEPEQEEPEDENLPFNKNKKKTKYFKPKEE